MTEDAFDKLVTLLKQGNNEALAAIQPMQPDCIRMLRVKSAGRCSPDMAYDIFIDAVLEFRNNVLRDKVKYRNIKAYLKQICWYKWLDESRRRRRVNSKSEDVRLTIYAGHATSTSDLQDEEQVKQQQLAMARQALERLSEKCQRILKLAIIDQLAMTEIAELLGLANANVAKSTKSRCYKYLLAEVRKIQHNEG